MAEAGQEENLSELTMSSTEKSEVVWVDTHPECSVCLQACLQPVQLPCLHIFCFLCLKGFAFRSKKCALCRSEVALEYFNKPVVVKVKEIDSPVALKEERYDWFYEGRNGWWQYDERASTVLEEAFKSEARSCELLIAGFLYLINFENMVQFRKTHPARCRRIKRDKAGVDRKGIAGLKIKLKSDANNESLTPTEDTVNVTKVRVSDSTIQVNTEDCLGVSTDRTRNIRSSRSSDNNAVDELISEFDRTL